MLKIFPLFCIININTNSWNYNIDKQKARSISFVDSCIRWLFCLSPFFLCYILVIIKSSHRSAGYTVHTCTDLACLSSLTEKRRERYRPGTYVSLIYRWTYLKVNISIAPSRYDIPLINFHFCYWSEFSWFSLDQIKK